MNDTPAYIGQVPDLSTKVTASVSGFVTDQNDEPIYGASVNAGTITTTTDKYGYFEIKNTMVVKQAATVTVEYAGYFKGIKTFGAVEGKSTFFRIKLMPKTIAGTLQAGSGGSVTLTNGLSISFPSDAVKNAATGLVYTGTVSVAAQWIDPTSAELNKIMPGDLRGINTAGYVNGLATYGMAAIELTGSTGELLQIADGKKANISFPLPSAISSTAPATIALWYFDETKGLWKEEGVATRMGDKYVGEVSHFSFWNCDVPMNAVIFSGTIVNDNVPVPFTPVKISVISNPNNARWGYTDSSGYVSGYVPGNAALKMEIFSTGLCNTVLYSQNFNTGNTSYSAGVISVPSSNISTANVTGMIKNCSNNPVSNGYIMIRLNNQYTRYYLNNNGVFNFSSFICTNPSPTKIWAVDLDSAKQSPIVDYDLLPGINVIPTIQACGFVPSFYDGKFKMNGFHNRPTFQFPYTNVAMEMITVGLNEVAFYWPDAGSFGHPFATDANNTLSWYGTTISPVVKFNQATNEVTEVYNLSTGPVISLYTGSIPTHNYYNSTTRKIYVAWQYNNSTDRAFFDTLSYIGPR